VRFYRQYLNDLAVKPKCPAAGVGPEPRQKPVIMTGAAAQPITVEVKRETRHKHPIDFFGFDGETVRSRFGDVQGAGFEIASWIQDLEQPHDLPLPIDLGKNNSLTGLQRVNEKRPGLKLFDEPLRVEQDGTCFGITGKLVESPDKGSLLGRSFLWTKGQDQRPDGTPEILLEVGSGNALIHQGLAQARSGAVSIRQKNKPVTTPVKRLARANQTSTAMPLGRF
jgi:hypothetical protein